MIERRDSELTDLKRRISNQIVIGTISQADHKKARYRLKFGNIETDWIPDTQARSGKTRSWEGRDVGEQVIAAAPSGDLAQAVIVGSIHTDATQAGDKASVHSTVYPDGTRVDYDDETNTYTMNVKSGGSFLLSIAEGASIGGHGGKLTLEAPDGIDFISSGNLTLQAEGNIVMQAGGRITAQSGSLSHNGKDIGATHLHKGVQSGGSLTGEPR